MTAPTGSGAPGVVLAARRGGWGLVGSAREEAQPWPLSTAHGPSWLARGEVMARDEGVMTGGGIDPDQTVSRLDALARRPIPVGGDPVDQRRRRIDELVAAAARQREPLERLRSTYQSRLHQAHDDFGTTGALRLVNAALAEVPHPDTRTGEGLDAGPKVPRWRRRRRRIGRGVVP